MKLELYVQVVFDDRQAGYPGAEPYRIAVSTKPLTRKFDFGSYKWDYEVPPEECFFVASYEEEGRAESELLMWKAKIAGGLLTDMASQMAALK